MGREKEKKGREEIKKQRSRLSLALAKDRIGSVIRCQDIKSVGEGL